MAAAAADADRPRAAILGKTRNNHGLINKYRQTGPNHHPWEDAFTEQRELTAGADYGAGRAGHDPRGTHTQLCLVNVNNHQYLLAEYLLCTQERAE